jgi:hypothetical protein
VKSEKLNLKVMIALLLIIVVIGIVIVLLAATIHNNESGKASNKFENELITAAEKYIADNKTEFSNFKEPGDITVVAVSEMIDKGYIKDNLDNKDNTEITDYYVKATIKQDGTISYEIVG